ncbi:MULTISPECIES: DUF6191 domain-containing protein [unclassified Streptomyces]|uniref:DUF6191 domain-containing protein n=1 Tax=unclassified Streptomyces TaxID=2593676 RepID=UPI001E64FF7F|nr:DUF6191 domain-containing protein [Streptomyces sp. CB02980]MCB8903793.1 DUF6191 domain-containing protein [Streptomyces sp. CB02980]
MFDPLAELFAPGRRHTEEELRRQALTREDPGDADPSRGPIDLTSGRVTIRAPRRPAAGGTAAGNATAGDAAAGGGTGGSEGRAEEVEAVGQGGGLAPAGDAELGEDVGDVDAGRLG